MKKAFTVVEVTALFILFIAIACLVVPISLDDTRQVKNIAAWRSVHAYFLNLFVATDLKNNNNLKINVINSVDEHLKEKIPPYEIKFMNGETANSMYVFDNFNNTTNGSTISFKWLEGKNNRIYGMMMFDANGKKGPNIWGKDVFGLSIHNDGLEPFCKNEPIEILRSDCSKYGRGVCCSYYYLIGGNYE